jgi:hypothetical protein
MGLEKTTSCGQGSPAPKRLGGEHTWAWNARHGRWDVNGRVSDENH